MKYLLISALVVVALVLFAACAGSVGLDGAQGEQGLQGEQDATGATGAAVSRTIPATNTITSLDTTGIVGRSTSVTIGADGLGLISYFDSTNGDLKVLQCENTFCSPYFRRR
jgi:hypothetical protein